MTKVADVAGIERATAQALAAGHRLFQTHRIAEDDGEQVGILLEWMAPPDGAVVLDAGCGIGEMARLLGAVRQDLSFVLLNISSKQLELCPQGERFTRVQADFQASPLADECVDVVLFASALTQMDARAALMEASRLIRPGGIVFLFEMARLDDALPCGDLEAASSAKVPSVSDLISIAQAAGLNVDCAFAPRANDELFRCMLRDLGKEHLLDGVQCVVMRFVKPKG